MTTMPDRLSDGGAAARAAEEHPVVLTTHGLTKSFNGVAAVDHLDLCLLYTSPSPRD